MKNLKFLVAICSLLFLTTPNSVAQSFLDDINCAPPVWCEEDTPETEETEEGEGENGATKAADAVGDASQDPDGCVGACAVGKGFFDLISGAYDDCYPNCNLSAESSYSRQSRTPIGLKIGGGIKTYEFLTNSFVRSQLKPVSTRFNTEFMAGGYVIVTGMYIVNKGKKNEYRAIKVEIRGRDRNRAYDTMYVIYDKRVATIVNRAKLKQIRGKKSSKRR